MKSVFKKESLIMTLVLVCYGFIAGGSVDLLFSGTFWTIIGILTLIIIVVVLCWAIPSAIKDEKKIEKLKKDFYGAAVYIRGSVHSKNETQPVDILHKSANFTS